MSTKTDLLNRWEDNRAQLFSAIVSAGGTGAFPGNTKEFLQMLALNDIVITAKYVGPQTEMGSE